MSTQGLREERHHTVTGAIQGDGGWIKVVSPSLVPPSLKDNTADADRLIKGLEKVLQPNKKNIADR